MTRLNFINKIINTVEGCDNKTVVTHELNWLIDEYFGNQATRMTTPHVAIRVKVPTSNTTTKM